MANSKTHEMVRALGMGMTVLDVLIKELEKQHGSAEMLQFLTRPRFADNLQQVAKVIIACDWRIPASEMRERTEKSYCADFGGDEDEIESIRNLQWWAALYNLGIPYLAYNNEDGSVEPPVPSWICKDLGGRTVEFPLMYDEKYVVVALGIGGTDQVVQKGDIISAAQLAHPCSYLSLAERRYFDFDK